MGLFPEKSQVGLYVDSETITVVSGQVAGQAVSTAGFSELRAPTSLEGDAQARQKTLDLIKTALQRAGVKSKNVLIAVPGEGSMTRHFELPPLPKKEERNAVRFEAQKYVPFDAKNLYYDYETYFDAERQKNRVVFFACKKQWVDAISAMLTLADMKISQVELVSQSVARAFHKRAVKRPDEVSLVIIGNDDKTAELIIQKQGSVLTTRHVALTRLADGAELDVPMFVSDVRISLDYFSENFKTMKVERIFVATPFAGQTATLCEALGRELSLPADAGSLFEPPAGAVSTTAATAAYGLTLGAIDKKGRRISLKPTEQSTAAPVVTWEQEKKQLQDLATKELIGVLAFLALLYFLIGGSASSKNQELQRAIESYPKAKAATLNESLGELQGKENAVNQKSAFFRNLDENRVYFTTKMNELAKTVPPNVRLSQWTYVDELNLKGGSDVLMKIEGYVMSAEMGGELTAVNRLVQQLMENKEFMQGLSEIRIARTSKTLVDEQTVTKFTLDCANKRT